MTTVLYLHGFASSPGSTKANLFQPAFAARGAAYQIPDLNQPNFETLTLTAILDKIAQTVREAPSDPVYLIGSSLGGLAALHFYDRYREAEARRVTKMVLLAPALQSSLTDDAERLAHWQAEGSYPFFNYAAGGEKRVHYGLVEDLQRYDSFALRVDIPVLIYHGKHDESVDYLHSVQFAASREWVTCTVLDSDHQLLDQTTAIQAGMMAFFGC